MGEQGSYVKIKERVDVMSIAGMGKGGRGGCTWLDVAENVQTKK